MIDRSAIFFFDIGINQTSTDWHNWGIFRSLQTFLLPEINSPIKYRGSGRQAKGQSKIENSFLLLLLVSETRTLAI